MKENLQKGSASIAFSHPVYFRSAASVVGEKEGEGPLKTTLMLFPMIPCSVRIPGKQQKAPCSSRLPLLQSQKQD